MMKLSSIIKLKKLEKYFTNTIENNLIKIDKKTVNISNYNNF